MTKKISIYVLVISLALTIPVFSQGYDSVQVYLQKAGKALMDKIYPKALENYNHVVRIDPNNFEAIKNLGVCYSATGDQIKAKEYFERAFGMNSMDHFVCNNLGVIYSNEGDVSQAVEYYEKAVALSGDKPLYLTNLGQELLKTGQNSKALAHLRKADSISPKQPIILFSIGNAFASSKVFDSAEVYYERCIDAGQNNAEVNYFLASVERNLGKDKEAIEHFQKVIELQPKHVNALMSLGLIYMKEKSYEPAIGVFDQILEVDKSYINAKISKGVALSMIGEYDQSNDILNELFQADSALGFKMLDIIKLQYSQENR